MQAEIATVGQVSIPNGKSGPLRRKRPAPENHPLTLFQSQTGSQALSDLVRCWMFLLASHMFQSQTGSQALSDATWTPLGVPDDSCFNPKREVRPSQTTSTEPETLPSTGFNPKREVRPSQTSLLPYDGWHGELFQSQTGSQALSDLTMFVVGISAFSRFNPKREVRPSQTSSCT